MPPRLQQLYYDRSGKQINADKFAELFCDMMYKVVEKTYFGDIEVSTVWLGLNHAKALEDIEIFETMVFTGDSNKTVEINGKDVWRYATEQEAVEGHFAICNLIAKRE